MQVAMSLDQAHVVVIGGGFVGQMIQLSIPRARLLDWRKTPPENHLETRIGPQYLWEPIPDVSSESFVVTTLVDGVPPTDASILAYKKKIGKEHDGGDWGLQFRHITTGWNSKLPVPRVEYGCHVEDVDLSGHTLYLRDARQIHYDILINTIPLDFFLKLCTVPPRVHSPWKQDAIYMAIRAHDRSADNPAMTLNYISDPAAPWYRITTSSGQEFLESLHPLSAAKKLPMGKIHTHPESEDVLRKLAVHDCYCFGRFATWRPDELAHGTWRFICNWKEQM